MSVPAACAALLVTGCVSTLDIKSDEDLRKAIPDPVRVLTVERVEYELTTNYTEDSVLCGTGTMLTDAGPVPFDGAIPFSRIVYIQGTQKSVGITGISPIGQGALWATRTGTDPASGTGQGLYRMSNGRVRLVADLFAFELANDPHPADQIESNPYDVQALDGEMALVADAAANDLLRVDAEGNVEVLAIFPVRWHPLPTSNHYSVVRLAHPTYAGCQATSRPSPFPRPSQ